MTSFFARDCRLHITFLSFWGLFRILDPVLPFLGDHLVSKGVLEILRVEILLSKLCNFIILKKIFFSKLQIMIKTFIDSAFQP